jgi:O-antigen ligase
MTTFSRTSQASPFGRLLTIRRRHFDFAALELPVTRLAIFFSVFPALRPAEVFFTYSDILFCLSAVLLLLSRRLRFSPMGPVTVPWMVAFAVLSCGLVVSSLLGDAPERALVVVGQYAFAYILLAYILVRTDESIVDTFVRTFVLGTVCVNAFGLAIYFFGVDETFRFVSGSGRLTSFMGNPNANANVIALTLPLLLYLWFAGKWRLPYVLVSLAILAYALVATSSVGGLLWSLAGVAVFIVLTINWRVLVGVAVCLAVAVPLLENYGESFLPETFQLRVLEAMQSGDLGHAGTFSYRMGLIHEALDVVDDRLLVGLGADQYRVESDLGAPVHDVYLLLWAEGGLPALIGWLMLPQIIVLTALWVLVRPGGRLIAATTLAVVVVFLLAATGNSHMYARFWVVPVHLCTALLMIAWARHRRRSASAPAVRRGPRPAAGHLPVRGNAAAPAMRQPR